MTLINLTFLSVRYLKLKKPDYAVGLYYIGGLVSTGN